jgi:hypothetical protein
VQQLFPHFPLQQVCPVAQSESIVHAAHCPDLQRSEQQSELMPQEPDTPLQQEAVVQVPLQQLSPDAHSEL